MSKDELISKLREHARANLTPTKSERDLVSQIYAAFCQVLSDNCIQIGSYARFTAIRPLHDLDILHILGSWDQNNHSPEAALRSLFSKINKEFKNPTSFSIKTSLQTHSITVVFSQDDAEILSVDIVPAYKLSKNEFGDDTYKVPEIVKVRHGQKRSEYYKAFAQTGEEPGWIASDPRGYIRIAQEINKANSDYRKTVKLVKAWKYSCEAKVSDFKLKSFHIEQILVSQFRDKPTTNVFDGIFEFFTRLPEHIDVAQIPDRADPTTCIDEYLNDLTKGQKELIIKARDGLLKKLEEITPNQSMASLLDVDFYRRASHTEQYLFDFGIPTFLDAHYSFEIMGEVQERKGGFRKYILDKTGTIVIDRYIKFSIKGARPQVDHFKWKVKNDDASPQPRGEITDHHTRNDLEHTQYKGHHFVECYAVLNKICVAKARQNVVLDRPF